MKIADLMTPDPVTVGATAPLADALATLQELGIRHLPVLEGGLVVGVVSDRDLMQATGWMWNEERGQAPRASSVARGPARGDFSGLHELEHRVAERQVGREPEIEHLAVVGLLVQGLLAQQGLQLGELQVCGDDAVQGLQPTEMMTSRLK